MLDLIKPLPAETWALCPFMNRPPTIAEYNCDPQKYQAEEMSHGIYKLTVPRELVKLWSIRDELYAIDPATASAVPDLWQDRKIKIHNNFLNFIDAHASGNFYYNNNTITLIGQFKKAGSVIQFYPLTEVL